MKSKFLFHSEFRFSQPIRFTIFTYFSLFYKIIPFPWSWILMISPSACFSEPLLFEQKSVKIIFGLGRLRKFYKTFLFLWINLKIFHCFKASHEIYIVISVKELFQRCSLNQPHSHHMQFHSLSEPPSSDLSTIFINFAKTNFTNESKTKISLCNDERNHT